MTVYGIRVQVEGNDFGAALREAWQRRNEIGDGSDVVVISPTTTEEEEDAVKNRESRESNSTRNRGRFKRIRPANGCGCGVGCPRAAAGTGCCGILERQHDGG